MSSFRIEESQLREWHAAASQRTDVRGVAAVAKELEAHLARKDADGSIVVSRHQLFTWAEALQGAAARASDGVLQRAVDDMRATLSGRAAAPAPSAAPAAARAAPAQPAFAPPQPAPAVTYVAAGAAPTARAGSASAFVVPQEIAPTIRELLRGAASEVRIVSPWATGLETLVGEIALLAPSIRVMIVSRRPEREDASYHQAMDTLGRRRAVTAFSPHIQTRMVIADSSRVLLGAASIPIAQVSREAALVSSDPVTVAAAIAHFERVFADAGGTRL